MKKWMFGICVFASTLAAHAQEGRLWKTLSESTVGRDLFAGRFKPQAYKLFQLDNQEFSRAMSLRNFRQPASETFTLTVPNADGMPERFICHYSPVMDPALAARYPEIKTFAGTGIDDPSARIYFDYSPRGFHGMIMSADRKTIYIDPLDVSNNYYVVFSRKDAVNYRQSFQCLTRESAQATHLDIPAAYRGADDGRLRTYRLALACTGEYAQYFLNGTETSDAQRKSKVLAAMSTLMVRTNGIYERDFGIRMNLIANNDAIIYLNGSTDPWTTEWNTKTQQTIDAVIGNANYDIGHLVHKESSAANNNGNAGCIGCVCVAGSKGSAFTSHVAPEGDPFVVDYTTHEMGHQFGANHTFTFRNESGTASQFEPGSGSTIMGYAGITGSTDVQSNSDDYFHTRSIEQVTNYVKGTTGGGCAVVTLTGNSIPVVSAGSNVTIPRSTPFALTATASDADPGQVLTYTWEQINAGTSTTTVPSTTATSGPCFRSRNNGTNPVRNFPILSSILDGTNGNTWERLPSVARTLNFRLTARDNRIGGGANQTSDVAVTISSTTGPFAVTAPNTAVSWAGGSAQTITWSVNGTNGTPINCANVRISLSTDGGQTFPTVLAATTANDGSEVLTIPNTPSTTARIKVEAVGNIFFDISNTNFTITSGSSCGTPTGLAATSITNTGATLGWSAVSGALNYDVDYKANSSATWISAAAGTTALSVSLSGLVQGTLYDWRVRANCSSGSSAYGAAQFTTTAPFVCNAPAGLTSSNIASTSATVSWTAVSGAANYTVNYKANSSATWITAASATTATSVSLTGLTASTLYDWQVRTNCSSGSSGFTNAQFTTTAAQASCVTAFEPNETQATAAAIATNTAISAAIASNVDSDYYRITTTVASNLNITLTGLPADYDLYVYNNAGALLGSSTAGSTSNETVNLSNQAAGNYFIRVIGYNGVFSTTGCYSLRANATAATGCANALDNSTNGTTSGAPTIPFNTNVTGLVSPSGDIDLYRFVITTSGTITLTLSTLPADYDLRLLNSAGTQVAISQNGGTTSETINFTAAAGTYFARVYGYNNANNATSCYTLRVQLGTATKQVEVPVYSVNDPVSIYPNPTAHTLNVSVQGTTDAQSSLRILDGKGQVLLSQRISRNTQPVDVSRLPAGMYMIRIFHQGRWTTEKFVKE